MKKTQERRGLAHRAGRLLLAALIAVAVPASAGAQLFGKRGDKGSSAESPANVVGDTIKVGPKGNSLLKIIGPKRGMDILHPDYSIRSTGNTIFIRATKADPEPFTQLLVDEGTDADHREHMFIVQFVESVSLEDQITDISSIEKIRSKIAALERGKSAPTEGRKTSKKSAGEEENDKPNVKLKSPVVEKPVVKKPAAKKPEIEKPEIEKPTMPNRDKSKNTARRDEEQEEQTDEKTAQSSSRAKPAEPDDEGENEVGKEAGIYRQDKEDEVKSVASNALIARIPPGTIAKRVEKKIDYFFTYCTRILAKDNVAFHTQEAMKLFNNNDTVNVERTSARYGKSTDKIRRYLQKLSRLGGYTSGVMKMAKLSFVTETPEKGPDGKYHVTAVVMQDFAGFKDGVPVYQDKTAKTIDIIVEVFEVFKDGEAKTVVEIFLGDISVADQN